MGEELTDRELARHVAQLMEHFDCVQIFVQKNNEPQPGVTQTGSMGAGNWYARFGQITEWLVSERRRMVREADRHDWEEEQ